VSITHGVAPGNVVQFAMPNVQIDKPSYKQTDNIVMLNGSLRLLPNTGNDELVITFK
jgi:hypothetical protein